MNARQRGSGVILVVEDDALIRESLCHALESEGYEVLTGYQTQGYLKKPVSLNAVLETIETFCSARAPEAPPAARVESGLR
jgi:CheY-like chemotaxis protein